MAEGDDVDVEAVRHFNRLWTRRIGVLQARLHHTPYTLTEARVLFELAHAEATDLTTLRRTLDLDGGYLSRLIGKLKDAGLVLSRPSPSDGRRQELRLSARGRRAFARLDERAAQDVAALLALLDTDGRRRLVTSLVTVEALLEPKPSRGYVLREPRAGELGWVVARHGAVYADEFGWDQTFEALVARVVADFAAATDTRQRAWIAEVDGEPAGCVFCCRRDEHTAQLRLLLVEPRARGLGVGAHLVRECIDFARRSDYRTIVLWTNDVLVSARRIYEAAGFALVRETPHHSFGRALVGQDWSLDLTDRAEVVAGLRETR